MANSNQVLQVAVGILIENGEVLISQRLEGKGQAGLWEFPGGKIETGEAASAALIRELHEELGIQVQALQPLKTISYDYQDFSVRLVLFKVLRFSGEPFGKEGQIIRWVETSELERYNFLEANQSIIRMVLAMTGISTRNMSGVL